MSQVVLNAADESGPANTLFVLPVTSPIAHGRLPCTLKRRKADGIVCVLTVQDIRATILK